jgi:hypothetical protein
VHAYALVDDADFDWLSRWTWRLSTGYAVRVESVAGKPRSILMHRAILGLEYGDPRQGEHENRDKLDCRRSNLRIAERADADNQQNRGLNTNNKSGYRGVYWYKRARKWKAQVQLDGKMHHLGYFTTAELADAACKAFRAEHMPFSEEAALAA